MCVLLRSFRSTRCFLSASLTCRGPCKDPCARKAYHRDSLPVNPLGFDASIFPLRLLNWLSVRLLVQHFGAGTWPGAIHGTVHWLFNAVATMLVVVWRSHSSCLQAMKTGPHSSVMRFISTGSGIATIVSAPAGMKCPGEMLVFVRYPSWIFPAGVRLESQDLWPGTRRDTSWFSGDRPTSSNCCLHSAAVDGRPLSLMNKSPKFGNFNPSLSLSLRYRGPNF